MLALREAAPWLLLGAVFGSMPAAAQTTARPPAAPAPAATTATGAARPAAAPSTAPAPIGAARPPTAPAAPSTPGAARPATSTTPATTPATTPTTSAAPGTNAAGTAGAPPAAGTAPAAEAAPPPMALAPPGSIFGTLAFTRGGVPKHSVVYLEGAPTGSFAVPKERLSIMLRGFKFQPEFAVVPVGQTVHLINADRLMHSPFSLSPTKTFEISRHAGSETHTLTFDRPGVVDVFCNIHESMQGLIVVVPSTFYALPAPDGSFQLGGVPAGRYRLHGYSPEADPIVAPVEVRARERAMVKLQLTPVGQSTFAREKQR